MELTVYRLVTPLARVYRLPFGDLPRFDSFVAVARHGAAGVGLGETMPLPGYSHEDAALVEREHARLAAEGDLDAFLERNRESPFVTSAVTAALDGACVPPALAVRLCPLLKFDAFDTIETSVAALAAAGARVAKVKIGPDVAEAIRLVERTREAGLRHGVRFRYDANQTLTREGAAAVLDAMEPDAVELFEQPLHKDDWAGMGTLKPRARVPLMLDESIVQASDVERAANCSDLIKLKLAKNGSITTLLALIRRARALGLDVVLGNGAQGTVGCLLEGWAHHRAGLARPGEMSGWLKIADDPLGFLLEGDECSLRIPGPIDPARLIAALETACVTRHEIRCERASSPA